MIYLLFLVMFSNQFTHLSLFNMIFHGIQSGFNDTSEGDEEKRVLFTKSSPMTTLQITDIVLLNLLFSLRVHVPF